MRATAEIFEQKVLSESKNGEGEWGETLKKIQKTSAVLQVYCISLVKDDKTVLECSGPRLLKVTSRAAKG